MFLKVYKTTSALRKNCFKNFYSNIRKYSGLQYESLEESYERTTVEADSKNPDRHPLTLTGYGTGVFKFAHVSINGSVAIVDKVVFKWNVIDPRKITAASFSMFYLIYPKMDIVVVGTGDHFIPIHPDVIAEVGKRGVKLEVQDTRHACGTYNLLKRDRPKDIGAALIPVTDITEGARKMIGKGKSRMVLK